MADARPVALSPPAAPACPEWTNIHRAQWAQFLQSDVGQVLWARFRAIEADTALRACQDVEHTVEYARHAAGFADARAWLESLSRVSRDTETTASEVPEGEELLAERFTP